MISDRAYYGLAILIVLIVGLVGGLSLHETFSGDQAMFMAYSRAIDSGAVLYRDVWDIKQPAIFIFYLLAGKLFSFDEAGVHKFELIYFCAFALFLAIGLRRYFTGPLFALLTPLFTIGAYYAVSETWHLTQVEGLVCFPLFLSLWFCQQYLEAPERSDLLILSGIFGGIVILFKLLFIGILFPIWLCLLIYCYFCLRAKTRRLLAAAGYVALGISLSIAPVVLYFAYHDSLSILWYTTFEYPYNAATALDLGNRSQILKEGLVWFVRSYFPFVALTLVLAGLKIKSLFDRRKTFIFREIDPRTFLFAGLSIWLISGLAVILIQRFSWWEYHYSLLMPPLGILAAKGAELLFEETEAKGRHGFKARLQVAFAVAVLLLFIPVIRRLENRFARYGQMGTVQAGQKEIPFTGNVEGYDRIAVDTRFLARDDHPPKIFVLGSPVYYTLSNTVPAISTNGWMPEGFTDVEWRKLDREMEAAKPKYIFVENGQFQILWDVDPGFMSFIGKHYSIYSKSESLVIYRLTEERL